MGSTGRSNIGHPGPAPRGRPRRPMRALLLILALTCSAIYAADRAGPLLAGAVHAQDSDGIRAAGTSP